MTAETIRISADDGHTFTAYRAVPTGPRRGGVVVIQEIFGVNAHIRDVCDRFAGRGYETLAPHLFDRLQAGVDLGYDEAGINLGRALVGELGWDLPLIDLAAAARTVEPDGKAGVVGYCWGGTLAWLAAARLDLGCVASYYGRQVIDFVEETPRCPIELHFGDNDPLIPLETVAAIRARHPALAVFVYEGSGHGFNCDRRADYREAAAALALSRTLALFAAHLR